MKQPRLWLFLTVMTLSANNVLAGQALLQGNWAFDIEYNLLGIPQSFPKYQVTECIDETHPFPRITRPTDECQMQLQGHFGNTYTWMMDCSNDWEMVHGMGRIHYAHDRAYGDVHLQILNPYNPPQPMLFRIEGNYLGKCE